MGYIYIIINLITRKVYIGQSIVVNVYKDRIRKHLNGWGNKNIKKDLEKYGQAAFIWHILEENILIQKLDEKERYYINEFDCITPKGYNSTKGGEKGPKHTEETKNKIRQKMIYNHSHGNTHPPVHSEETRKKISQSVREAKKRTPLETRQKLSEALTGRKLSEETLNKIRKANQEKNKDPKVREKISKSLTGIKRSKETRRKMSEAHKSPVWNFQDEIVEMFNNKTSVANLAIQYKCSESLIRRILQTNQK